MSKISNGRKLVIGLDGRTRPARRYRDLCRALADDLGREPTEADLTIIKQCAVSLVASEALQARALRGECSASELSELARLGNLTARLLNALGIRARKHGDPDALQKYLAEKAAEQAGTA